MRLFLFFAVVSGALVAACGLSSLGTGEDADAGAPGDASLGPLPVDAAVAVVDATLDAGLPTGLLYYYPFNGDTKDYSGHGYDLTNSGAVPTADRHGVMNAAYMLDGNTSFMEAPGTGLPRGSAARTMTVWLSMTDQHGQWGIVQFGQGDCTGKMFGLGYQGSTAFWSGCNDVASGKTFPVSTWTFVALVYSPPTALKVWTNGTPFVATLGKPLATTGSHLFVGVETIADDPKNARNHYKGAIDDLRIYDHALSDDEVRTLFALP